MISHLEIVPRGADKDGGPPRVWRRHRRSQFGDVEGLLRDLHQVSHFEVLGDIFGLPHLTPIVSLYHCFT